MLNFPKLPPNDEHKTTFSRPLHSELRNETRKQCESTQQQAVKTVHHEFTREQAQKIILGFVP